MNFKKEAAALVPYIVEQRRWIHSHAELSFKEKETTAHLKAELEKIGWHVQSFPDYLGLVATLSGPESGPTVLLRADIDALPIQEPSGLDFASCTKGVMHACGHDCHSSMLLGAARLLQAHQGELAGTVKLLFQSAEESCYGSRYYVEKGVLKDASACLALHVWGSLPAGFVSIEDGYRMASCDNFKLVVKGVSAHGSTPHLGHDAIVAASAIILNLQTFVSRENNPLNPLVVSVGTVKAGKQFNIIADRVELEGTVRTYSAEVRKNIPVVLERIARETAVALGCTIEFTSVPIEPAVNNCHLELNQLAREAIAKSYGPEVLRSMPRVMGSEDFSVIMEQVPGVMCFLGYYNEQKDTVHPLHSAQFTMDEDVLPVGAALYAGFAYEYLERQRGGAGK